MYKSITISELMNLNNINIIDIRDNFKYNNSHILNAKNIESQKLLYNPSMYLDKNNTYYIYCDMGVQSKNVCRILSNMGYNVVNIIGGYNMWKNINK